MILIERRIAGRSVAGRDIVCHVFGPDGGAAAHFLLFMGNVHGDEPEGRWLLEAAVRELPAAAQTRRMGLVVAPCVNPDGARQRSRVNASGVDLNRNLPTRDWQAAFESPGNCPGPAPGSEPETQAVLGLLNRYQPRGVISVHSMKRFQLNSNGPALEWAQHLAGLCGYPVTEDIGYPCPGSFGTYAGAERGIPTITLEIERGMRKARVLEVFLPVLHESVRWWEARLTE